MKINSRKGYLQVTIVVLVILFLPVAIYTFKYKKTPLLKDSSSQVLSSVSNQKELIKFTPETLKKYNGTDPKLPIYLVMDGDVYDVTSGSEFYKTGGPYHYLAGKDSSFELHLVGGDIIKRKYPVIGKLITTN